MSNRRNFPTPPPVHPRVIGYLGLLSLVFVVAKLFAGSTMTWFWVFFPVLIPTFAALSFLLVGLVIFLVACVLDAATARKRRKRAASRKINGRAVFA